MGVSVRAHIMEMVIIIVTIQPSCANITPAIPLTIVNGRNTAIMVSVEATIDSPTSFVPLMAAGLGRPPRSMCVVIFSSTTIASSTTSPIASDNELSEMIFSVPPVRYR